MKSIYDIIFESIHLLQHFYTSTQNVSQYCSSVGTRFLQVSWRRCHSSSEFSFSQFFFCFFHVIPDKINDGEIRSLLSAPCIYITSLDYYIIMAKRMFGNVN